MMVFIKRSKGEKRSGTKEFSVRFNFHHHKSSFLRSLPSSAPRWGQILIKNANNVIHQYRGWFINDLTDSGKIGEINSYRQTKSKHNEILEEHIVSSLMTSPSFISTFYPSIFSLTSRVSQDRTK